MPWQTQSPCEWLSIQPEYLPCTECPGLAQVQGGCSPPISCHPPPSQPGWPHFLLLLSAAEMQTVWRGVSLPGRFQSLQVCALPLWGALSNHTKRWLRPCLLGTVSRAHSVAASLNLLQSCPPRGWRRIPISMGFSDHFAHARWHTGTQNLGHRLSISNPSKNLCKMYCTSCGCSSWTHVCRCPRECSSLWVVSCYRLPGRAWGRPSLGTGLTLRGQLVIVSMSGALLLLLLF